MQTEHLALRERKRPDEPLGLEDVKLMKFTRAVSNINVILTITKHYLLVVSD